ncbi:MAG TPA: hypothetical protein VGT03_04325 [Candidatus Acidoferrales bacterium]|nr:hypothetical protein [Candidatus Acidoferrales bacterium]
MILLRSRIACCVILGGAFVAPAIAQTPAVKKASVSSQASITFRKVFKASYPEFVEIKVGEDGTGTWDIRQLDETPSPHPLRLGQPLTQKIFDLASDLHDFQGIDIDVHRRIANLGQKTFRYDKGAENYSVEFNYTLNNSANQLTAIFDGLSREELDLSDMERAMRYDHLGANDVMLRVQKDIQNKLLPEPEALLLLLDQIGADEDLVDIARQRARAIAEQIRASH